ncbi:MAG: hypothetical protein K0S94_2811 [Nitrospira sp.]|nr:hypothetical protein [Nitrospira sp.]
MSKPPAPPPKNSDLANERLERLFDLMDMACDSGIAPHVLAVLNFADEHGEVIRKYLDEIIEEDAEEFP